MQCFLQCLALLVSLIPFFNQSNAATTVYKYFRRDYSLDNNVYPEIYPIPTTGGKVHIVFTVDDKINHDRFHTTYPNYTKPFTVSFGGNASFIIDTNSNLPSYMNWIFCEYDEITGQVWLSAHFSDDYLLGSLTEIAVSDSKGNVMGKSTSVGFSHSGLELLYVSIKEHAGGIETQEQIVIHWYNYYNDAAFNIAELYLNGVLMNGKKTIDVGPLQHTVVTYNITDTNVVYSNGAFYTIGVILVDGLSFGFGGRYLNPKQKWNILGIPISSQCPFPSTNDTNYKTLSDDLYINSLFLTQNDTCNSNAKSIISDYNNNWSNYGFNTLALSSQLSDATNNANLNLNLSSFANVKDFVSTMIIGLTPPGNGLAAMDGIKNSNDLIEQTHNIWKKSLLTRFDYITSMTSIVCMTNHQIGIFSGITDIQIISFHFAGCQSNSINSTIYNLSSIYEYFENARLNQMPNPTYALIDAFTKYFDSAPYGLTASEINIGIGSALAAGLQGIILNNVDLRFQTIYNDNSDNAWQSVGKLMSNINYLEDLGYLRIAAPHGTPIVTTDDNNGLSLWSSLRVVDELIIIAVNLNCQGYNKQDCQSNKNVHWQCTQRTVNQINITLPDDFQNSVNVKEIVNGQETHVDFTMKIVNGTMLQWFDVQLDDIDTTRIFLLTK